MSDQLLHATTVALYRPGQGWIGVLLTGPSGSGKSDLALRLLARGWRLVADDYIHIFASDGRLFGTAPTRIAGLMEMRGVGIIDQPVLPLVRLGMIVALTNDPVERLPQHELKTFAGVNLPRFALNGFEPSAVEKVTVLSRRL